MGPRLASAGQPPSGGCLMLSLGLRDDRMVSAGEVGERLVGMVGRVSSPRFVGRRNELAAIEAALTRTRGGHGSVVLVAGEAGIGKSRLISEIAGRAERERMAVVVGECLPLGDGEMPYAPVVGALRSSWRASGKGPSSRRCSLRARGAGRAAARRLPPWRSCGWTACWGGVAAALVRAVGRAAGRRGPGAAAGSRRGGLPVGRSFHA